MAFLLLTILIASLILTSLITPIVYELLLYLMPAMDWPFSRVFDRVILVVVLVAIWFCRKKLKVSSVIEMMRIKGRWNHLVIGLFLALLMSGILLPLIISNGDLSWHIREADHYYSRVWKILLGALLTAIIEEFLFRGIILTELCARFRVWAAVTLTTLLYAMVHFVAPVKAWIYPGLSFSVGFSYLWVVLGNIFSYAHLAPFIGLILVGLVLAITKIKTNSLILCIGLHAGWIIAVKSVFHLTALEPTLNETLPTLAKRYFLVSQPVAWLGVISVGIMITLLAKKFSERATK